MIYATEQQVVVTSVLVVVVALVALFVGVWYGSGREREYVQELEEELGERTPLGVMPPEIAHDPGRAVARRPAKGGRHRRDADMPGVLLELPPRAGAYGPFPVSEEDLVLLTSPLLPAEFEAHTDEAMAIANDPSVTGWTTAMAADMDRFIADMISGTDEQLKEITR